MSARVGPAVGSALFFLAAPGTVAGLIPWLLTRWQLGPAPFGLEPLRILGMSLIAGGFAVLLASFVRFVHHHGTPAPIWPTASLVVTGAYRHVRNPMYVSVVAIILGQALVLGRPILLGYAILVWAACHAFILLYEEPRLTCIFGPEYAAFRRNVPRWLPRIRPWRGAGANP